MGRKHQGKSLPIKCGLCDFKTNVKIFAQNHYQIMHNKQSLHLSNSLYNDCPFCPKTFKFQGALLQHLTSDHVYEKKSNEVLKEPMDSSVGNQNMHVLSKENSMSSQNDSYLSFESKDEQGKLS